MKVFCLEGYSCMSMSDGSLWEVGICVIFISLFILFGL